MSIHLDLNSLLETKPELRDEDWEKAFLHLLPTTNLRLLDETPKEGPDGFPYLLASIDAESSEPAVKVIDWLASRGIGLVINPAQEMPDYVFTYGQLWNFKSNGHFISHVPTVQQGQFKLDSGQKIMTGAPTEEYLPIYVREILRSFFTHIGKPNVKILMLSPDHKNFDLCFSLDSLGEPVKHEHRGILEAISWFLPGHYSIALIHEKGLPPFHAL